MSTIDAPFTPGELIEAKPAAVPVTSHLRWPAERFYWSILEIPGVPVRTPRPPAAAALDLVFANDLPVPIDDVHAVYARLDDRRVLACAVLREDLKSLPPDVLLLAPASWPECIAGSCGALSPGVLNLLAGEFEPRPIRKARMARAIRLSGAILLAGVLVAVGLSRRASAWKTDAAAARDAMRQTMLAALPEEPVTSTVLPLRLKAELDQLRRTRRPVEKDMTSSDASAGLAALLSAWPKDLLARTEIVSISPTSLSINILVDANPQPLLDGLDVVPGWVRDEPRVTRSGQGVLVSIQYRKERGK